MRAPAGIALITVAALSLLLPLAPAAADEADSVLEGSSLADRLADAADSGARAPEQLAAEVSLPADGPGSLSFDETERVRASIIFDARPNAATLAAVEAFAEVVETLGRFPVATAWTIPEFLDDLAEIEGVRDVLPDLRPETGSLPRVGKEVASTELAPGAPCPALPIEADLPLMSEQARERFGVDGTGVTVGIISDSFDARELPTSWAEDVAAGALPGTDNPCGYTDEVEIVGYRAAFAGADEGRAMAQLVHGLAPGARIVFASSGNSQFEMAENILALADAGADVIVDDILFFAEPYFQLGPISHSIEQVKERGVLYFTSAGNQNEVSTVAPEDSLFGHTSIGAPHASWRTDAYRSMACPDWVIEGPEDPLFGRMIDCMDFDPSSASAQAYDRLVVTAAEDDDQDRVLGVLGSLAEPMFGVTTQYELRFFDASDDTLIRPLARLTALGTLLPGLSGTVPLPDAGEVRMVLLRVDPDPGTNPAFIVRFRSGADIIGERQFMGDGRHDIVGPTVFGHAADGSALSTASLHWDDPQVIRSYSSLGPAELRFEPVDESMLPSPAYPEPIHVATPHIAAVDGTQTTFFGEETDDGLYRFFGTSAAAPHAAAVAALSVEYAPVDDALQRAVREELILSTARGSSAGGPVNSYAPFGYTDNQLFGAGIIDAVRLLGALPVATPDSLVVPVESITAMGFEVLWAASDAPGEYLVELFAGDTRGIDPLPEPLRREVLPAESWSQTFTDLASDSDYTVILTPRNDQGDPGAAAELLVRTAMAPVPSPDPSSSPTATQQPASGGAGSLPATGDPSPLPWLIGGGAALIVLAAVLLAVGRVRARRDREGDSEG